MSDERSKGELYLLRAYSINCGLCINGDTHASSDLTRERAEKHFADYGWIETKAHGWICRSCHAEKHGGLPRETEQE